MSRRLDLLFAAIVAGVLAEAAWGASSSSACDGGWWGWWTGDGTVVKWGHVENSTPTAPIGQYTCEFSHTFHAGGGSSGSMSYNKPDPDDYPNTQWMRWWPANPTWQTQGPCQFVVDDKSTIHTDDGDGCWDRSLYDLCISRDQVGTKKHYAWSGSTGSYAAASDQSYPTWAECETTISDPYHFENSMGGEWGFGGRIALGGIIDTEGNPHAAGSIDLTYRVSFDGEPAMDFFRFYIPEDPDDLVVECLEGVAFWRNEVLLSPSDIADELKSYYAGYGDWSRTTEFGDDFANGFYLNVVFQVPEWISSVDLSFDQTTWASDAKVPAPSSLCVVGLGVMLMDRRRRKPATPPCVTTGRHP